MQRPARILVLGIFAALLAGCAPEPVAEVTPSPTFASEAEAFAAAEATYRAYVDALNQVDLADPETFEAVYAWTTGEANASAREYLSELHADGATLRGQSQVDTVVALRGSDHETTVAACLDVHAVELLDVSGESIVDDGRPDKQSFEVAFVPSVEAPYGLVIDSFKGGDKQLCG